MNNIPDKFYFRQRLKNRLYEDVITAIELAALNKGVRRTDIACKLDVHKSQITRWLSGPGNWEVDTISDLLWAIDCEMDFKVEKFCDRLKQNYYHPLSEKLEKSPSIHVGTGNGNVQFLHMAPDPQRPIVATNFGDKNGQL